MTVKEGSLGDSSQRTVTGYLDHFVTIAAYFVSGVATSGAFWFGLFSLMITDSSLLMHSLLPGFSLLGVFLFAFLHHKCIGRSWMRHTTPAFIVGGSLGAVAVFILFSIYAFMQSIYYE